MIRYAVKILAELMHVMCYACVYMCYPKWFSHDYITYKDYMNSIYLDQPRNKVKGNISVEESGKVNPAILYRNWLEPEKQTITQELYGLKLPGDQIWKLMK